MIDVESGTGETAAELHDRVKNLRSLATHVLFKLTHWQNNWPVNTDEITKLREEVSEALDE